MTDETATSRADSTCMTAHLLRLPRVLEMTGLGRTVGRRSKRYASPAASHPGHTKPSGQRTRSK